MGYEIPTGYANAIFRHTITGDPEEMCCGLGISHGLYTGSMQDLADELFAEWKAEMVASLPNTVSMTGVTLYEGDNGGAYPVWLSAGSPLAGSSSGSSVPPNVAVILRKQTALAGRANRGRMFFPGVSEGLVSPAGILDSTLITQIQGDITSFLGGLATLPSGAVDPVLLHTAPSVANPVLITSMVVDSKVGSQRRRLR